MSKKTVRKALGSRKPSPKKTKGLIAKGEKTRQSVQDPCVLDNRSHNAPAVSEPANTHLLKYCCSRNQATQGLFLTLPAAGWVGGRRRRP